jgi:hypothetical protein
MTQEIKKSVVEQAADALRLWSNAWSEFEKTGKNKPASIEEVIEPFIQMESEKMLDAYLRGIENYDPTFKRKEQ